MPGKKATGTNTATSTMPITMTALSTSCMPSTEALNADLPYSRMWRSMFSTTTMASSTTMPIDSTMPKSVRVLIEKPNSLTKAKVPISDTGMVTAGMSVLRQFCRKRNITRMTSPSASASVFSTSTIDSRTTVTLSNARRRLEPGREALLDARHLGQNAVVDFQRVGRGQQLNAEARGLESEEAQVGRVALRAELDAADIGDANEGAVLAAGDDHVGELIDFGQAALGADAQIEHLPGRRRRLTKRTSGHLDVLLAKRAHDIAGGERAGRQLGRIDPQPHRVTALAEDDDVAHAGHALDGVADVAVDVVADELGVVAVVREKNPRPPMNPAVFFVTVMPLVRTSAGMRPSAWLTRFWTSMAARSGSRSMLKVAVMVLMPLLVLDDCR